MNQKACDLIDQCVAYCTLKGLEIVSAEYMREFDRSVFERAVADYGRTFAELNDTQRSYIAGLA